MILTVKNWADFQHYKDRSPPWIKLHKGLLDNYEYQCLPLASRALAPMIWLLASESVDGSIDADLRKLAFRLRTTEKEIQAGLTPLIEKGFLIDASNPLAERKQDAMPETEKRREEKSGDNRFAEFWSAYPKKKAKSDALKAWGKAKIDGQFDALIAALELQKQSPDWLKNGGEFIPFPATWINGRRWEDEITHCAPGPDSIFAGVE